MDERPNRKLTAEEAGEFVAQWAEHRSVTADELAQKLEIDSASVESLLNRSRGRLSMEKWATQRRPTAGGPVFSYGTVAAASTACLLVGGMVAFFLFPRARPSSEPSPDTPQAGRSMTGMAGIGPAGPAGVRTISGDLGAPYAAPPGQSTNFRPVAGDGDPVQRAGLMVGTEIAREATETHPGVTITDGPNGHEMPHVLVAKGAEAPNRSDLSEPPGTLVFNATSYLVGEGIPVPDDISFRIRTPAAVFMVEGHRKGNLAAAESLRIEDLLPILGGLMTYAIDHSPPLADAATKGRAPEILLRIGTASRNYPIEWSMRNQDRLLSMFAVPVTKDARSLIQPFLDTIHEGADKVFHHGNLPAMAPPTTFGKAGPPHPSKGN